MRKLALLLGAFAAALTLAAAATAGSPAMKIDVPDESFTDVNPCTGATVTVTLHYTTFVIREGGDAAGGFHITGTGTGTATTSDGFSGRFTFWFGGNVRPDGSFNETFTNSNTLGDGSGARILITVASHVTIANGELRVEHEQVNFRCVGKTA
jgi:hypothetical protein